ncbi:MAG: diguanylate cyclase [Candidatus Competibacteraceae bacterium]|jgi:diguanylate cyclase (GGDEF)-like protein|nr:diguanylate cyclase [Candidatus Competibacteraceae bacterium]
MISRSNFTLRQMLTIPYVVLVLLTAGVIGVLSYNAGRGAVDTLSDYVLSETVNRIAQAVDKHISGSEAVLETAFPSGVAAPSSVEDDLEALRTRFWLATSVHRDPNNYAYYGNRNGQFFGLWRFTDTEAELRLRTDGVSPRSIYRYSNIRGELKNPVQETRIFEPRERPWYKAGQRTENHTWTSIYIDFKTLQLVSTRARRVNNTAGEFEGVVATDLSLQHLNEFLKRLKLSPNGFAFIVEPDGNLLATSRGPHLRKGIGNINTRLNAAANDDPWIAKTYKTVKALTDRQDASTGTRTSSFIGPDGAVVQAGYARLRDNAGLDWIVAVAVPRHDFMQRVTDNVKRTVWLAIIACLLIVVIGFVVLNLIVKDLRKLAVAAHQMGDGILDAKILLDRNDEIGDLAKSFAHMQQRLLTDRLTGIANREAIVRRIEDRIIRQRRRGDNHPFAVLFVDLNEFKQINDRFGHDVGDRVLQEIGERLATSLRESDTAARFGGDEFVVLLDNVANRNDAMIARDKLERVLAAPLRSLIEIAPDVATFAAGAAIGIALCPEQGNDTETLLKQADEDMFLRKQARAAGTMQRNPGYI